MDWTVDWTLNWTLDWILDWIFNWRSKHWPSVTGWYVIKQKNTSNQVTMLHKGNDPKSKMVTSRSGGTLHTLLEWCHRASTFVTKTVCNGAHLKSVRTPW